MDSHRVDRLDPAQLPDGSRRAFDLEVARLADGSSLAVPVNVVAGRGSTPCLVAVAGVHGDEADGIMALMELWEELAPEHVTGRLVMVPVANPAAFRADQRRSPLDDLDLNRVFPGKSDGSPSHRLASRLFTEVLRRADFVFSLHGWSCTGDVLDYVEFNHHLPDTSPASFRACQASGFEMIRISDWPNGLMTRVANEAGVPGMEAEVGGLGIGRRESRERYKGYTIALMQHLGMLDGEPPSNPTPRLVESFDVLSPIGGLLRMCVELGEEVKKGDLLATLHDLHGNLVGEVAAPDGGLVGSRRAYVSVGPGDRLVSIFRDVDKSVIADLG